MERVTQREEVKYQQGRRDAINCKPTQSDDLLSGAGWMAGTLERLEGRHAANA